MQAAYGLRRKQLSKSGCGVLGYTSSCTVYITLNAMAKSGLYRTVIVESFIPADMAGRHGLVHIRPTPGQVLDSSLFVECSKRLMDTRRYPLGTKFKLQAKLTDRLGGTPFLYAYHGDPDVVVSDEEADAIIGGFGRGNI